MAENRSFCGDNHGGLLGRDSVCIDCNRILDSCRDKDCYEDVRVYLTDFGQEIIEKAGSIRAKTAQIIWTTLIVEPVQFNRGFYQIYVKFYVKICFETCISPGKSQDIEGIAVCEKKVILYGSEGNVHIFQSDPLHSDFCAAPPFGECHSTNLPTAVCEAVDPICLTVNIRSGYKPAPCCCCCVEDIPDMVCCQVNGNLTDTYDDCKKLYVSLGFFSVIRLERKGQYLISATEYCVPDKECVVSEDSDPCTMFKRMAFPTSQFCPPSFKSINGSDKNNDIPCERRK